MEPTPTLARRFWAAIEPVHAVVYFAPEPTEAARKIGLRGFWMSYFASRVAPLGSVPAAAVGAMAYGWAPARVARAIPDAFGELADLLWQAVDGCRFDGGIDATLTFVATGAISRALIQPSRGWSDADWEQSARLLQARGLLDSGGRLTKTGGAPRREVEDVTDRLAAGPVERLGETGVLRAIDLATPVSRHLIDSGVIPVPNPIGVPRP